MSKTCLVYIGGENPPDYCLENFVDEADLLAMLEANCRRVANAKRTKNFPAKNRPGDKRETKAVGAGGSGS